MTNTSAGNKIVSKTEAAKEFLNTISPSMCLAKWFHVSMHLTNGRTHSCYHPPTHQIDIEAIKTNPKALHNTEQKKRERRMMLDGKRPEGCAYCWMVEDAPNAPPTGHTSDRHFRSSEQWAIPFKELPLQHDHTHDFDPSYVEVNFNQACNFKCSYCSPHLSTAWEKEIREFGPYPTFPTHNHVEGMSLMPEKVSQKDNAYVQAFWEWWPTLYPNLRVFRMTGGEPLMDKNTFKVLDYVAHNPHPELVVGITSNLCPPEPALFDRLIDSVQKIERQSRIHYFALYVSVDGFQERGEYIRNGLDFKVLDNNIRTVLRETQSVNINLINTFNALSVTSLKDYLAWVIDIRRYIQNFEHEGMNPSWYNYQRMYFDIPMLRQPEWQSIQVLPERYQDIVQEAIEFAEANSVDKIGDFVGFYEYEIERIRRNLRWMKEGTKNIEGKRSNFYRFFNEHDRRRGTNFLETYPEMEDFWNLCKKAAGQ
jgi:organic radical activating enzyme